MSKFRMHLLLTVVALSVFAACAGSREARADTGSQEVGPLRDHAFAQIGIQVDNLDRAVSFYRDVLGLRLLFKAGGMVFFQVGEARLMIEHGTPGRSATLYFDDSELERNQARLEAQGIKFAGPIEIVQRTDSYDLKLLEFSDPDGNPLALMGKVKRKN